MRKNKTHTPPVPTQQFSRRARTISRKLLLMKLLVIDKPTFVHIVLASRHVLRAAATNLKAMAMLPMSCQDVTDCLGSGLT
jgi:hypothetical protein